MSPTTSLAQRPTSAEATVQAETLGTLLAQIRHCDIDSLHASFEVPTIFAEMPWTAGSHAVIDEADGDAESQGLQYVLEVALARDLLAELDGAVGYLSEAECLDAVTAYSVTGHAGPASQTPWVSRCLAC